MGISFEIKPPLHTFKVAKFPRVFWIFFFKLHKLSPLSNISCSELEPASLHISVVDKISIVAQMVDGLTKIQTVIYLCIYSDYTELQKYTLCKNKSKFVVQRSTYIQCFARKQNKQLSKAFERFLIFFPMANSFFSYFSFAEFLMNLSMWSYLE